MDHSTHPTYSKYLLIIHRSQLHISTERVRDILTITRQEFAYYNLINDSDPHLLYEHKSGPRSGVGRVLSLHLMHRSFKSTMK